MWETVIEKVGASSCDIFADRLIGVPGFLFHGSLFKLLSCKLRLGFNWNASLVYVLIFPF